MSGPDQPTEAALIGALEGTWPAESTREDGPFLHRAGAGGGQRVSASTVLPGADPAAVLSAIAQLKTPLFRVLHSEGRLSDLMDDAGLVRKDATLFRIGLASDVAHQPGPAEVFTGWPPLELHRRIWAKGGIGPARLAVMDRVNGAKTALLGRLGDAPVATGFVAIADDIAMLHALEVAPEARRKGVGARMTAAAAHWAEQQGARWFGLAVTEGNAGANALYAGLGLTLAGGYHYRVRPGAT